MENSKNQYEWLLEQYKLALDASNIISITDSKGVIEYVNDEFCNISGYSREELIGKPHNIVRHPDMSQKAFKDLWESIQNGKIWKGVIKNRKKDGGEYVVDSTVMPIKDDRGIIQRYIAIRHNITQLIEKEELLAKQTRDRLTGLYNKVKLYEDIENCDFPIFTILNIDDFSEINDFYGLEMGDLLLKILADKLDSYFDNKQAHRLYRLHGDEYGVLTDNREYSEEHMSIIGSLLLDIKKEPFELGEQKIYISLTAGSALESDTIIGKANMALKYAKKEHKFHQLFDPTMLENYKYGENIEWSNKIRKAIENDRIVAYFQPILNIATGEIEKYEALVRLIDENGAIIAPAQFLEVAKKTKQYPYITKKMIDLATKAAKKSGKEISVNITIEDVECSEIVKTIEKAMIESECGELIVFEITETEEIKNYHALRSFIELVKTRFGSKVAIDDFGSGYSNFENLLELDFDYLKIDGSIVAKIESNRQSDILLDAIVAFSQKLDIKTIAEFVSNENILKIVSERNVDYAQGYFIGKPEKELLA
jgi:PAS domain S-box-containing protein/diguanylate cyclase (GGDEF)-like protein